MAQRFTHRLSFLKTTALGGIVFLLPLIVIGALLGEVIKIVWIIAHALGELLPTATAVDWTMLLLFAFAIVLAACFLAGLAAEWTFSRRFSSWIEKKLLLLFPRYSIIKAQLAGTLGDERTKRSLKPVLVELNDAQRLAFEVDRQPAGVVTVYLPGSPDPWSGSIAYFQPERVLPAPLDFDGALALLENLGIRPDTIAASEAATEPT